MWNCCKLFILTVLLCATAPLASADNANTLIDRSLLSEALSAQDAASGQITNPNFLTIIDYRLPSSEPRFHLIDLRDTSIETHLVAHGAGSDTDHDEMAEAFSNIPNSKMTSLGAFVTGKTYHGKHGLSLKLHGLEAINDKAEERLIVIHGADYVAPGRKLGRSWGCPALENAVAQRVIPLIKDGSFVYVVGRSQPDRPTP